VTLRRQGFGGQGGLRWYRLTFPKELTTEDQLSFLRLLSARHRRGFWRECEPVVFEVHGVYGSLTWWLGLGLRAQLPGIRAQASTFTRPAVTLGVELRLDDQFRGVREDVGSESAVAVLDALCGVGRGEALVLSFLVGPWLNRSPVPGASPTVPRTIWNLPDWGKPVLDAESSRALRAKQAEPLFGVVGRIAVAASRPGRREQLLRQVVGALQVVRAPGVGLATRHFVPGAWVPGRLVRHQMPKVGWPSVLSAAELAAVLGWPIGNPVLSGVVYRSGALLPADERLLVSRREIERAAEAGERGRYRITGRATYPGREGLLNLAAPSALHHLHLLGPTGVGKSTLMAKLVLQDIAAGRGVVAVDPKGDLLSAVLERVQKADWPRIVVLDPSQRLWPIGLNVLSGPEPELVVDGLVHVFHQLYAASWGPRTQDILHAGLLTLSLTRQPDGRPWTLLALSELLSDAGFRRSVVGRVPGGASTGLLSFWAWFEGLSVAQQGQVCAPLFNKLRGLSYRRSVRLLLGQPRGVSFREVFTKRQVMLISLSRGTLGPETAQLLGGLLLSGFWQQVQQRAALTPARRHPVMLHLDEFQDYLRLPLHLGDALAQARSLGVGLTLAHQALYQLTPEVRSSVLANARSRIVFQLGVDDAKVLQGVMGSGLRPDNLTDLGAYETFHQLFVAGATGAPASALSLPLGPAEQAAELVARDSRQRYGRPAREVEAALTRRPGSEPRPLTDESFGVKRRSGGRS
jgi:hypothetical protein